MSVNLAPGPFGVGGQFFSGNTPLNGGLIYTYAAGTTTPLATYTTPSLLLPVPNANPITLTSQGICPQEIWLTAGLAYKFVVTDSIGNVIYPYTMDNITGINDFSGIPTGSEWIPSGVTPTFVSTSSFTLPGDQTSIFTTNRRVQLIETAGTVYGVVTSSSVSLSITTVNVALDSSAVVDAGLSAVNYGILNAVNPSIPQNMVAGSGVVIVYTNGIPTFTAGSNDVCDFRLTLTTGVAVTVTDVTGATTVFCAPYKGNRIALYDGTKWNIITSAQVSIALGTLTSALPYDVFAFNNAGVVTLEILAWSTATARATALVLQDGVLSKTGALTRRYLGTFLTTSTTQTEDSIANRFLWNYYNRVLRPMIRLETTASWNYTVATFRQANASTANQLNFLVGISEDAIDATATSIMLNGTTANVGMAIGLDSATTPTGMWPNVTSGATLGTTMSAYYKGFPGIGKHFLSWLEISQAAGTTTWYGNGTVSGGAPAATQSGIQGNILA